MNTLLIVFAVLGGVAVLGVIVLGVVFLVRGRSSSGGAKAGSRKEPGGAKARSGDEEAEFDARFEGLNKEVAQRVSPDARATTAALERDFKKAVKNLRDDDVGRDALTSLPLYITIGPSAAGKTQLLLGSRVFKPENFTKGTGPTLNCAWWLSKQAIVLDTAGRWSEKSSPVFLKFLELVKDTRRGVRPLNGLIVVLPANQLVAYARDSKSAEKLDALCSELRERVAEVISILGVEIPVYLVISKCDRLGGFEQLFSPLKNQERERAKVWGLTIPEALVRRADPGEIQEDCEGGLRELAQQIERYALKRLGQDWERFEDRGSQAVTDDETADVTALCGFLPRFQDLLGGVREVVEKLLDGSFRAAPMLRGVYFTSSTQTQSSVFDEVYDQILKGALDVAPAYGKSGSDPAKAKSDPVRRGAQAFFVGTLMRTVLEGDAGLAYENPEAEVRRARRLRRYTLGVGVATVLLGAVMGTLWARGSSELDGLDKAVRAVQGSDAPGSLARTFDGPEELAAITRAVVGGTRIGVSNDARVQLAMTYRVFVLNPIFQELRGKTWRDAEPDTCFLIEALGRESAPGKDPAGADRAAAALAGVWQRRARATTLDAAVVEAGAELYRAVARENASGEVWMDLNPHEGQACCAAKQRRAGGPEDRIEMGVFTGLPKGMIADHELKLKYTVAGRKKFADLLADSGDESMRQVSGCSETAPSETALQGAYDEHYRNAWVRFMKGLHWAKPDTLTPAEMQSGLNKLIETLKPLFEDATVETAVENIPAAGKVAATYEKARAVVDAPEIKSFRELPSSVRTTRDKLENLLRDIETEAKNDQPNEDSVLGTASDDLNDAPELEILRQPFEQDYVRQRLTKASAKHHAENAQAAWCAFRNNKVLKLYPFAESADAAPDDVQAWLDAFDPQAFDAALPEASQHLLADAQTRLADARAHLGSRLDGGLGSNRTIMVSLGDPAPRYLLSVVMTWDGGKVECNGRCLGEPAIQPLPLPVSKIAFQIQDDGNHPVRMAGWSGPYSFDRIVQAAGEGQKLVVTLSRGRVLIPIKLGEADAGFWPAWESVQRFASDILHVKPGDCTAAPTAPPAK